MKQVTPPTAEQVLRFLGWPTDGEILQQAHEHVSALTLAARAYTRGRGWQEAADGALTVSEDIAVVIVSAAARSLANPTLDKYIKAGSYDAAPGSAASWSLMEHYTLNGYRRMVA